jgi:hypothetical protein
MSCKDESKSHHAEEDRDAEAHTEEDEDAQEAWLLRGVVVCQLNT